MKRSDAIKGASISPIEDTVDRAMVHLPMSLDLSKSEDRERVRIWMVRICATVTQKNVRSFTDAAKRAIDEAGALAIDPKYYATRKKRREKYKVQRAVLTKERSTPKAEREFNLMSDAKVLM